MLVQKVQPTTFIGLDAERYLRLMKPEKYADVMRIYHSLRSKRMDWENYISKYGTTKVVETADPIKVELVGIKRTNVKLVRIESIDAQRIGDSGAEFNMVFDGLLFSNSHTVVSKFKEYPVYIISEATKVGGNYSYKCVKFGIHQFIPAYVMEAGSEWGILSAPATTSLSLRGPTTVYAGNDYKTFAFSKIRSTDKIPGELTNQAYSIEWINEEGKQFQAWDLHRSMTFENAHYDIKMNTLIHGRTNVNELGKVTDFANDNKREIVMGEGLLQQYEKGTEILYNEFNIEEFGSIVDMSVSRNDIEYTEKPIVVVTTGSRGMQKASTAITKLSYALQVAQSYHDKNQPSIFGINFNTYKTPGGTTIIFQYEPAFDNNNVPGFKTIDGENALSSTFMFTPVGKVKTSEGSVSSLMYYKTKRHGDYRGYMVGATGTSYRDYMSQIPAMKKTPMAGVTVGGMDMEEDAAIETRISEFSVVVLNPNSIYTYKPANVR